jgi:hypothetical protein
MIYIYIYIKFETGKFIFRRDFIDAFPAHDEFSVSKMNSAVIKSGNENVK